MIYEIPEANLATLVKRVQRLNARAAKIGSAPVVLRQTGNFRDVPHATKPNVIVRFVEMEANVEAPAYNGWHFMAVICRTTEGNIIRSVPGYEVPVEHRDGEHRCDHCHTIRNRRDTYVVRHDDGRTLRVGSTCIQDFLQHANPNQMTQSARTCFEAAQMLESAQDESWLGGSGMNAVCRVDLEVFLGYVAELVLKTGRYITSKSAYETGGTSTAQTALQYFQGSAQEFVVSEQAKRLATEAREWVLGTYGPRFDDDLDISEVVEAMTSVRKDCSDFEHNLLTAARLESIEPRFAGIAAYIIEAHRRSKAAPKLQLGANGAARIFGLFSTAKAAKLKHPAIRLSNGSEVLTLSMASDKSSNPGHLYVKGNAYYGKITPAGRFLGTRECPPTVEQNLVEFAANPEEVAARFGKLTGQCCFCGRPLTDERSTDVGYGHVCAKKFGLRWGKVVNETAVEAIAA
jgi:hypothetical protein